MEDINKVTLRGKIGSVSLVTGNGGIIMRITLGTTHQDTTEKGNVYAETQWHDITAFQCDIDTDLMQLSNGQTIQVEGMLRYATYTANSGEEKLKAGISANKLTIIG